MADVIRLSDRAPRQPRRSVDMAEDAKILLFTGVRYEHLETLEKTKQAKVELPIKH